MKLCLEGKVSPQRRKFEEEEDKDETKVAKFFGSSLQERESLNINLQYIRQSYLDVEKLQRKEVGTMGSVLAIWSDKHHDAKKSWTTDFAKSQFVSYLYNLLYLITYHSYLIIYCGFFVKDQVTALVADIMRQAQEKGQVVSQESAKEYAMRGVLGQDEIGKSGQGLRSQALLQIRIPSKIDATLGSISHTERCRT